MFLAASLPASPVAAAFSGIQWDPLEKLGLTSPEKSLLRSGEDNPIDYTLSEDACMYARTLLKVLSECSGPSGPSKKVSKVKETLTANEALQMLYVDPTGVVMHYAIQKLYEVISTLTERKERSQVSIMTTFYSDDGKLLDDWRPLLRILHLGNGGDPFAQCGASLCLAYILLVGCPSRQSQSFRIDYSTVREPLQALLSWISSQLQSSSGSSVSLVTPTLMALIDCKEARHMFAASGGIGYLSKHLKRKHGGDVSRRKRNEVSVQQLYELTFALWTTSYELNSTYSIRVAFADMGAVKALCDLVASAPREKVVRVALSSLCNLAQCKPDYSEAVEIKRRIDGSVFLDDMIACGLTKSVDLLKQRRWSDEDILEDLKILSKMLHDSYHEMSRWELYEHEILSGNLEWGILHNEKFFRQNAKHFEGENSDFPLLKKLIRLASLEDEDVACVACFDLGEFARHYPNGRSILNRLGAKDVVMRLIESENEQLSHQALQSPIGKQKKNSQKKPGPWNVEYQTSVGATRYIKSLWTRTKGKDTQMKQEEKFKVRGLKTDSGSMRTNDDVHKSIPYDPLIEAIVDTPQMQRLRGLKQLGTSEMTYIATTHSRFEHSWGVMHLAERLAKEIRRKQPKLGITDKDIACVKIAGLLHDLGHGPFSHVYDGTFRKQLKVAVAQKHWLGQSFASKFYEGLPKEIDEWSHEDGSLMMIDALLAHLGLKIDESNLDAPLQQIGDGFKAETFGISRSTEDDQISEIQSQEISDELPYDRVLTSRDWIFIKECIVGGPLPPKGMSVDKAFKSNIKQTLIGRPDPYKEFLYDIVSNRHSGLDVDKIDYLARDNRRAFGTSGEVDPLLFENAYVAWGQCGRPEKCWRCKLHYQRDVKPPADARHDMHLMVCYPSKMIQNAMNFFKSRFRNHEYLYTHHNTNAASYMICDILLLADPFLRLSTFNEGDDSNPRNDHDDFRSSLKLPISRANLHPQSYLLLTDSILDVIAANDSPELKSSRLLLNRYRSHMLYKKIADKPISSSEDSKGFKYLWEEKLWNMPDEEIASTILKMGRLENASFRVSEDDIIVEKRQIHHGKGAHNPVNGMRFLPKTMISKATEEYPEYLPDAIPISEDDYECCIPRAFLQRTLRIYCRNYDKEVQDFLTTCYHAFLMFVKKNVSGEHSGRYSAGEDFQNEVSNHSTSRAVYLSQDSPMNDHAVSNQAWSNHSFNDSRSHEPASKKRKPLYQSLNIAYD